LGTAENTDLERTVSHRKRTDTGKAFCMEKRNRLTPDNFSWATACQNEKGRNRKSGGGIGEGSSSSDQKSPTISRDGKSEKSESCVMNRQGAGLAKMRGGEERFRLKRGKCKKGVNVNSILGREKFTWVSAGGGYGGVGKGSKNPLEGRQFGGGKAKIRKWANQEQEQATIEDGATKGGSYMAE